MNWIDRAINWLSPEMSMQRQAARRAVQRNGPRTGRRYTPSDRSFYVNTGDPNDARPRRLVDRARIFELVLENPWARKAMSAMLNSLVGWGITATIGGPKKVTSSWEEWIKVCDFYGRLDLYGLQELWARSMLRDGEVFVVRRFVSVANGIPLRLQSFDKGMLATHLTGDNIDRGIEYDADFRPVAYHFMRRRAGARFSTYDTVRFAAEDVIHLFHQEWIGQTEGVSAFEASVKRLGDVDEGIEAEVVKANIAACLVGFRYRPPAKDGEDPNIGIPVEGDYDKPPVEEFVPGMIETLDDGEQIAFSTPPRSGPIGDLARVGLMAAAAGIGVTAEQMTGDLSQVNFSSFKAGNLEFKRSIGRIQYLTFIPVCLERVGGWFIAAGYEFGHFATKSAAFKWTPPPFETIDREGEAKADILEMEAGLESRENLLAGRGYALGDMIAQRVRERDLGQENGLSFKGDPIDPNAASARPNSETAAA